MFALSFTSLAAARNQQIKEIKKERNSTGQTAVKKPLVPEIARRGIVALAIMTLAVSSAQARGIGGGAGGGLYHGPSSNGMNMNSGRQQVQPARNNSATTTNVAKNSTPVNNTPVNNTPVNNTANVQKTTTNLDNKPVNKVDGNEAGLTKHVDATQNLDAGKTAKDSRPLDAGKSQNVNKTTGLSKNTDLSKKTDLKKNSNLTKNTGLEKNASKTTGKTLGNGSSKGTLAGAKKVNGKLVDAINSGKLDSLTKGAAGQKLGLADQYKLMGTGNIAHKMNLADKLQKNGGWQKRTCSPIDSHYCDHCKGQFYCGPKWCPSRCWCPTWCGWTEWCSGSPMWFDPRPDFCEPVAGDDCEVDPAVSINHDGDPASWVDDDHPQPTDDVAVDLEVVAIRFVDNGNAEKNIGPRYRVMIRNNGKQAVEHPFAVAVILDAAEEQSEPTPRAGKTLPGIDAEQVLSVDIRLPAEANAAIKDSDGHSVEKYPKLGAVVDANDEIEESTKDNNVLSLVRDEILMVDPAVFAADAKQIGMGQTIDLAGEGLGPEAGQVIVKVGSLELQAEIEGWYDLGARIKLPNLPLAGEGKAELVVVRGDGAAANPIGLTVAAAQSAPPPPAEDE